MVEQNTNTAFNYLLTLINDLENAKNFLAAYGNLTINFAAAYNKDGELQDIADSDKQQILEKIAFFRSYAVRVMIGLRSLTPYFKQKENLDKINDLFNKIKSVPFPAYSVCEEWAQLVNDIVVREINVSLVLNVQDKYRQI